MRNLSSLGDAALLIPASVFLAGYLLATGRRWIAGAFATALGTCWAITVALKLFFRGCGASITDLDVVSPSGHASFATLFYGAVALLAGMGRGRPVRAAVAGMAAALVAAIAVSRVAIGAHSAAEVAVGLGLGVASLLLFERLQGRHDERPLPLWPLLLGPVAALALTLVFGRHLSLEHWIAGLAREATATLDICRGTAEAHGRLLAGRMVN